MQRCSTKTSRRRSPRFPTYSDEERHRFRCLFLLLEHHAPPGQEPCRGYAAVPNERHEPSDLEITPIAVFALRIEMRRSNRIVPTVFGYTLYQPILYGNLERLEEPIHNSQRIIAVNPSAAHFFFFPLISVFSSDLSRRSTFFTSSPAGSCSGTIPRLKSILRTATLLSTCSFSMAV